MLRHLGEPDQHPVLVVRRVDAADRQRLQAHERQLRAPGVAQRRDRAALERDAQALRRLRPVPEHKGAQRNLQLVAAAHEPAELAFARHLGVAEVAQFLLDVRLRNAQPDMQLERPGIDARRQREAAALELAAHAGVEVQREHRRRECQRQRRPAEVSQAEVSQELSATQHRRIL